MDTDIWSRIWFLHIYVSNVHYREIHLAKSEVDNSQQLVVAQNSSVLI